MTDARWLRTAERLPRFFHTTEECFAEIEEYESDNDGAARSLGMYLCPDCEERERLNATTGTTPNTRESPLPTSG